MIKVSFILPCYNVDRYIADCLDSIYAQNLPKEEFEVICVNDCSTDSTRSIIADYRLRHSNLILIDHEQNMNVGAARNSGIEVAKGEYIWFVDPDDMIKPNSANEAYNKAKVEDLDVLFFNNVVVNEDKEFVKNESVFVETEVLSGQSFAIKYFPNRLAGLCIVWRCLFKTSFLMERNVVFPLMCKGEDVSFLWKALLCANRVRAVEGFYYSYRSNPFSIGNKKNEPVALFSERILFANEVVGLLKLVPVEEQFHNELLQALNWCANSSNNVLLKMPRMDLDRYYLEIRCHRHAVTRVRPYMNRKSRFLFSTIGGKCLWFGKVKLLSRF